VEAVGVELRTQTDPAASWQQEAQEPPTCLRRYIVLFFSPVETVGKRVAQQDDIAEPVHLRQLRAAV